MSTTTFNILSIDGGGLRGIVPVRILQKLESITGKKVHQLFDMMAGTSTGGLITSFLTLPDPANPQNPKYDLSTLADVYTKEGGIIFPLAGNKLTAWLRDINAFFHPKFSDQGLTQVLKQYIATDAAAPRVADALLPILISTYDLKTNQPVFFKTSEAQGNPNANARMFDVCRATSAAPTYLPAYPFVYKGQESVCIDGGVFANNPTMAAIAEIKRYGNAGFYKKKDGSPIKDLSEVRVLSLGTGSYTGDITEQQAERWGAVNWITRIIEVMMKGVNQSTDYEAHEVMEVGKYLRANITIGEKRYSDMSDASPATRQYLEAEVLRQITSNSTLMNTMASLLS